MSQTIEQQKQNLVELSRPLSLMRQGYASLPEQRLFYIYLSRINARNPNSRIQKIALKDFVNLCDLPNTQNTSYYCDLADKMLNKIITVPLKNNQFEKIVLFGYCKFFKDEINDEWYFEIGGTDYAEKYFFDLSEYVNFRIEYALNLKGVYQIRLFTFLKAYQLRGEITFSLIDLKDILGIDSEEYLQYKILNRNILKPCQKEINAKTDISFTYEPAERKAKGKIYSIRFIIKSNEEQDCIDSIHQSYLYPHVSAPPQPCLPTMVADERPTIDFYDRKWRVKNGFFQYDDPDMKYYAHLCDCIFSETEMQAIIAIIEEITPHTHAHEDREQQCGTTLVRLFRQFTSAVDKSLNTTPIKHYFKYFSKMLENAQIEYNKAQAVKERAAYRELEEQLA